MRFSALRCEAQWCIELETVTPLLIRSPAQGGLDPRRPDMEVVRTRAVGGDPVPYVPGSSIKGVLRSRAARILHTVVPDRERADLLVKDLFGHAEGGNGWRSRLAVADAHPVAGHPLTLATRANVAIDRASGAALGRAPFAPEVVEQGRFACVLTVSNYAQWQLRLLAWVLLDVDDGFVPFGGGSSRGLGRMRIAASNLRLRDFRGAALSDWEGKRLGLPAAPRHGGLYWEAEVADYRQLLDEPALLPQGDPRQARPPQLPGRDPR
jgi:CRISPR-associated protein Csm3